MENVSADFTRRANQFLLKWHLARKDWESETEHQINLEQYKIAKHQELIERLEQEQ